MVARIVIGVLIGVAITDFFLGLQIDSQCVANPDLQFGLALALIGSFLALFAYRESCLLPEELRADAPCIEPQYRPCSRAVQHLMACTSLSLVLSATALCCRLYNAVWFPDCWSRTAIGELSLAFLSFFSSMLILFCRFRRLSVSVTSRERPVMDGDPLSASHIHMEPPSPSIASLTVQVRE